MATDRKLRPRTSSVWRHFGIKDDQNCLATCYYCRDEFSYRTSVSNLRKHLNAKHKFADKTDNNDDDDGNYSEDEAKDDDNDKTSCSDNDTRSNESKDIDKTNNVWLYFTVKDRVSKMATCNLCLSELSYLSAITNLLKHLEQKHGVLFIKEDTENMELEKIDSDVDEGEKFEDSLNMQMRNRKRHSAAWKYFNVQNAKLKIAVCSLCGATLSYRASVSNLMKHVHRQHTNVFNVSDSETDTDGDDSPSTATPAPAESNPAQGRGRAQRSVVWLYFKTVDAAAGLSQCLICDKVLSHSSTSTNLKKHLSRKHPNVQIPGKEDGSKRVLLSARGQLYEVETGEKGDDDANKNQSSKIDTVYIEDFESLIQGNTAKRPKLTKRTPTYDVHDSSSDDEVTFLNKYAKKKSDSGDYFGKYITSLLKELPKEISMQLQTDFVRQIMNAQLTYKAQKSETESKVPSTESTTYSIVIASDVPKETLAPEPFSVDDGNKRLPSLD